MQSDPNGGGSNAELCAILQDGGTHAFFTEVRAIGGIEILQIHKAFAHFQRTVMPGNLRIMQGKIGPFAANHSPNFAYREGAAQFRPGGYGKNKLDTRRQVRIVVDRWGFYARGGRVRAGEGRYGGNYDRFLHAVLYFNDGGLTALCALELNLRMLRQHHVVQKMLLPAVDTARLHTSKLPRDPESDRCPEGQACKKGY
jgi:hypothetical protein